MKSGLKKFWKLILGIRLSTEFKHFSLPSLAAFQPPACFQISTVSNHF